MSSEEHARGVSCFLRDEVFKRRFRLLSVKQFASSSPPGVKLVESCLKRWALVWWVGCMDGG